jgi:drug/metabolite transporter (DMT)-like permease
MRAISTTWREGRYFDRWMVVHVLSGFTGALSNVFFELSGRSVMLLGLALLVVWEIAEYLFGVRESAPNRVIDVAVGFLGILAALWTSARLERGGELLAFAIAAAVTGGLAASGWLAYRRRVREQRSAA